MSTAYTGGAQFLAWGDGPSGPWVKILLPDSDDLAPFRGMTAAKKTMAGQLLAVRIDEVDVLTGAESPPPADGKAPPSHDQGSVSTTPKAPRPKAPQRLSQYAALLCQNPTFQRFIEDTDAEFWGAAKRAAAAARGDAATQEDAAAHWLRGELEIDSRAELDTNDDAGVRFHGLREFYHSWCMKEGFAA